MCLVKLLNVFCFKSECGSANLLMSNIKMQKTRADDIGITELSARF